MKNVLLVFFVLGCLCLSQATTIQTTTTIQGTDLRNTREMIFYSGRMTIGNRPQYTCRNGNGENYCNQYRPNAIRCLNVQYGNGVRWRCENYYPDQPNYQPYRVAIANERVVCDRHPYTADHVVDGSCHLEYSYRRN